RIRSEYADAILSLQRAAAAAGDDDKLKAESLLSTIDLHCRLGKLDEAEAALRAAEEIPMNTRRLQLLDQLSKARVEEQKGNYAAAGTDYSEVFAQAKRSRVEDLALEALARWARVAPVGGDQEARSKLIEEGILEARNSGRVDILFALMSHRARMFIEARNLPAAEADLIKIRSECEALGYLSQLVYTLSGFVALCADTGRWAEMETYATETIETARRLGNELVVGHTLAVQCNGKLQQGDYPGAVSLGIQSVQVLERLPLSESLLFAHGTLADAYAEWGKQQEGLSHYDEAMRLADRFGFTAWKTTLMNEVGKKLHAGGL
ncbi:MAG TPA: hypothetical protein VGU43_01750, partial [Thermoplasmata archaeon]|nr:hypothetical protein [Thermoplasmata archaeon]